MKRVIFVFSLVAVFTISALASGCNSVDFNARRTTFIFPDALVNAQLGPSPVPNGAVHSADLGSSFAFWGGDVDAEAKEQRAYPIASQAAPAKSESAVPSPKRSTETAVAKRGKGPSTLNDAPSARAYDQSASAGFAVAVYGVNGVDLGDENTVGTTPTIVELYKRAYHKGVLYHSDAPAVGDLVFFHNTYDRNGDGRWNDWYTLVGVVESVDKEGTVGALAYVDGSVQRVFLNLRHPNAQSARSGERLNTMLRADEHAEHTGSAGALFAGFANLLGGVEQVVVIDNWQPGMHAAL